jgi:hypothetical protein
MWMSRQRASGEDRGELNTSSMPFTRDVPRMLMARMFPVGAMHYRTRFTSGDVLLSVSCVTSGWHHGHCFRRGAPVETLTKQVGFLAGLSCRCPSR